MIQSLPTTPPFAIHATLICSTSPSMIKFLPNTLLVISPAGKITHLILNLPLSNIQSTLSSLNLSYSQDIPLSILPYPHYFLIPGLIDTHVHAPQHSMRSLGSAKGMHILQWLDKITFPHESRLVNAEYARKVYSSAVTSSLKQGITTACYYASLHAEATKILADICLQKGQRAFVGKVCMDNAEANPSYYREESAEASLKSTKQVIEHIKASDSKGELVRPILTPRFAISCTRDCLKGLGEIAASERNAYEGKGILIQTHFCEAQQEVDATLQQYAQFTSEVDLYRHFGLLNERSVLAHCTTVTESEIAWMKELDVGVGHCPVANTTVGGGFMAAPIRKYLDMGMKVGLGTDSGGGFSSSILDAMRQAIIVGNAREGMTGGMERRIGLEEVFYMGTLGGARVLGMGEEIGSFEVGKWFDAVVVNTSPDGDEGVMTAVEEGEEWERVFEKFVMSGDDRNMEGVYVKGVRRKG